MYEKLAQDILEKVGGEQNVLHVYHCQTRLRFQLRDENIADQTGLNSMEGVAKVLISGGVFQVVIGTHVKEVFEEIEKLVTLKTGEADVQTKRNLAEIIIDFVSGTFQPIVPALSGAGMVKALLALLVVGNVISNTSQTYYILNFFADGVFYFLPLLLAVSEAQKLACNPILAAGVAAIMLHPNWGALVAAGDPVRFFGVVPFTLTSYTSSVIPIILVVLVQAYVEKWLDKIIPRAVKLVFVPMLTFLVMGTLALSVLGPIGSIVGNGLGIFFNYLSVNASWAPALLIGGLLPVMVMFGLHNGVAPLGVMQMADLGYDSIFGPGCVCSNIAQGIACLVVTFRTKDAKIKQLAGSSSITALMGITEPALYGVNLPKKYPLVAAMIGGGCGGLYAGITHTHRFATGSSGLPAVLLYIGDDTMTYFINIIIALVISAVVTGILTYILSLKYETVSVGNQSENRKSESKAENQEVENKTDNEGICWEAELLAPMNGEVIPLEEIGDGVFSAGVLGQGCGIHPREGRLYAPFNGTVILVADTKHAIGLKGDNGMEVMVHVGLDTVELKGQGFAPKVQVGDRIDAGQLIMEFDLQAIGEKYPTVTAVLLTNSGDYKEITLVRQGETVVGDKMIQAKK